MQRMIWASMTVELVTIALTLLPFDLSGLLLIPYLLAGPWVALQVGREFAIHRRPFRNGLVFVGSGGLIGWHYGALLFFNWAFADLYVHSPIELPRRSSSTWSMVLSGLLYWALIFWVQKRHDGQGSKPSLD